MFHWKTTCELFKVSPLPGVMWGSLFLISSSSAHRWEVWVWHTSPAAHPHLTEAPPCPLSCSQLRPGVWPHVCQLTQRHSCAHQSHWSASCPPMADLLAGLRVTAWKQQRLKSGTDLVWSAIAVLLLDSRMSCRLTFFKGNKALKRRTRHASMLV